MKLTRRKLLIAAAAGAAGLGFSSQREDALAWRGVALGADAEIRFMGLEQNRAQHMLHQVLAEVDRLENIFSLYRPQSELVRLNGDGVLPQPSQDMRLLLETSLQYWQQTGGAFNPALQPIWTFLSRHFSSSLTAPPQKPLRTLARTCDPARITCDAKGIRLGRGMALSFNGVAQGYITDRVTDVLMSHGIESVLVNLGEHRALPGLSWPIKVAGTAMQMPLANQAAAQSSGRGTVFSPDKRWHHLISPKSGASANHYRSVTVVAPTATEADALSTALFVAGREAEAVILSRFRPNRVIFEPLLN